MNSLFQVALHLRSSGVGFSGTRVQFEICFFSSSLLLSSLGSSDTKVYEPQIRALLGIAAHFCEVLFRETRICRTPWIHRPHRLTEPIHRAALDASVTRKVARPWRGLGSASPQNRRICTRNPACQLKQALLLWGYKLVRFSQLLATHRHETMNDGSNSGTL